MPGIAIPGFTTAQIIAQMAGKSLTGAVPSAQAKAIATSVHTWVKNSVPGSVIHLGMAAGVLGTGKAMGAFNLPPYPGASAMAPAFSLPGINPANLLDAVSLGLSAAWSATIWTADSGGVGIGVGTGFVLVANPGNLYALLEANMAGAFPGGITTGAKTALMTALATSISTQFMMGTVAPAVVVGSPSIIPSGGVLYHVPTTTPLLSL